MTIQEAYLGYQRICDQWGDPFLRPPDFLAIYVDTRLAWLKDKCGEPETEYVGQALRPFKKQVTRTANLTAGIPLSGLPDLLFVRRVWVDFTSGIKGKEAAPIGAGESGHVFTNPHKRPDDWYPKREIAENRLMVYGGTAPVKIVVEYIFEPEKPVFTQTQAAQLPESNLSIGEILERLTGRQDKAVENYTRNQLTTARDVPARETNN